MPGSSISDTKRASRRPADPNLLSRVEAAEYIGVSPGSLAHWSAGDHGPKCASSAGPATTCVPILMSGSPQPVLAGSSEMGVTFNGKPIAKRRGGRGMAFDRAVLATIDHLIEGQSKRFFGARRLSGYLNESEIPSPQGGSWSPSSVYRMMKRAEQMGLPIRRLSPSEAASRKVVIRRPQCVIEAERKAAFERIAQRGGQTDTVTIAPPLCDTPTIEVTPL